MDETILQTHNLTKAFNGKVVVNNVNLTVNRGEIYGLIGKNGAGKTTIMRLALNLATPTLGEVKLFGGLPISECGIKIGSLMEAPALYKSSSAKENLMRFSVLYGADQNKIDELLDFVGLTDAKNKKVGKFSLGMKQRLGIAIALLGNPELVILDEPVNGLDPEGIRLVRELILKLNHEYGVSFLISSHLLDELSKVATKYGIINEGRLVEEITAEEIVKKLKPKTVLNTSDNQTALEVLNKSLPETEAVIKDEKILINTENSDVKKIVKTLSDKDVIVVEIKEETVDMENYFIEKMEG